MDEKIFTRENFRTYLLEFYTSEEIIVIDHDTETGYLTALTLMEKEVGDEYFIAQVHIDEDSWGDMHEIHLPLAIAKLIRERKK